MAEPSTTYLVEVTYQGTIRDLGKLLHNATRNKGVAIGRILPSGGPAAKELMEPDRG
jgi:hypothetical protein